MIKGLRPLAAIALLTAAGLVAAQGYPNKPVTIVVPFTAGGPTDTVARSLGQAMGKPLGQSVVIETSAAPVERWARRGSRTRGPTATPSCCITSECQRTP